MSAGISEPEGCEEGGGKRPQAASPRTHHIPLGGVLQRLDHFQSLFESHLLNQVCPDCSKFLEESMIGISEKPAEAPSEVSAGLGTQS